MPLFVFMVAIAIDLPHQCYITHFLFGSAIAKCYSGSIKVHAHWALLAVETAINCNTWCLL